MDPNNSKILFAACGRSKFTLGAVPAAAGKWFIQIDRRRRHLEAPRRAWPAAILVGRIAVRVAKKDSNRVYAEIETGDGVRAGARSLTP